MVWQSLPELHLHNSSKKIACPNQRLVPDLRSCVYMGESASVEKIPWRAVQIKNSNTCAHYIVATAQNRGDENGRNAQKPA